ncbi:MAG: metal ABC transporter permease [Gammaproteobacteria bacterium]|nr:metal ABC transporter permease [Gammaproteobacteria bacterium]
MEYWLLLPAFTMMALMALTHSYLGIHILARGIIFADLALAQIAALGASIAFLMGEDAHGSSAGFYAFAATFVAAALFSQLRRIEDNTTREVAIGVAYVVSTALSVVILSRSSQGMEELKSIFNGNILWVSWDDIGVVAATYALVSIIHIVYRRAFSQLSFGDASRKPNYLWEFFFFLSFAVVITVAVRIAGVLLVFAFLIIPAFSASLVKPNYRTRLWIAFLMGLAGALMGLYVAFVLDLPVGATVVSLLGLLPLLALVLRIFIRGNNVHRQ